MTSRFRLAADRRGRLCFGLAGAVMLLGLALMLHGSSSAQTGTRKVEYGPASDVLAYIGRKAGVTVLCDVVERLTDCRDDREEQTAAVRGAEPTTPAQRVIDLNYCALDALRPVDVAALRKGRRTHGDQGIERRGRRRDSGYLHSVADICRRLRRPSRRQSQARSPPTNGGPGCGTCAPPKITVGAAHSTRDNSCLQADILVSATCNTKDRGRGPGRVPPPGLSSRIGPSSGSTGRPVFAA